MTMSLFTLQSRCTNPTKHPLHRPSVDQTVKSKQPPIHRLLPRIPFPVPSVQPSPDEMEHVSTDPGYCHDSTSGFILGPRHLLNQVSLSGQHGAYFPGMLEQLRFNGAQVVEVPYIIQLRQHGESKANSSLLHVFRSGMPYIYQIMKICKKQLKAKFVSK